MDRPIVGVTVSLDPGVRLAEGVDSVYLKRGYGRAIAAAGGMPVLLVPESGVAEAVAWCDALVISGGDDLPARLPADGPGPPAAGASPENAERIAWERRLIDACLAARRPLLGVCYGMQLLNLHLGGTLHEDLAAARPDALDHGGGGRFVGHVVHTRRAHPALSGLGDVRVASSHRQAVDRLAPGFEVLAEAEDGVVEAIARDALLGVEWHPEADGTAAAVYGWLIDRARAGDGDVR
jgi:putative glutamine amidotransferase